MEALASSISSVEFVRDLEHLLDAFGSVVSLEDIASAYCKSGQDVRSAAEILGNLHGSSTSGSSTSVLNDDLEGLCMSSKLSDDSQLEKFGFAQTNSTMSKQKRSVVSMGTISGVIGKEYAPSRPLRNESSEVTKPLKINAEEFPDIWSEKVQPKTAVTVESMHKDTEEFLFKMLGDGFQLDRKIIQEVLGRCGYDIEKSMVKLLDLSSSMVERNEDAFGITSQNSVEKISEAEPFSCQEKQQDINSARCSNSRSISGKGSLKSDKSKHSIEKEILEALFGVPERSEAAPKVKGIRKPVRYGRVVAEPLREETAVEWKTPIVKLQAIEDENEDGEDSYPALRDAVKEYLITMKEYYKAAVDAFSRGEFERADKLLEEGHFFNEKARKADEKSAQKLHETREDEVLIDLHEYDPKEAISLLKPQLTSLSGIPTISYLKIIVGTSTKDTKEEARKRLILKFLERESIKWQEENNGQTIVIRLDEIDPQRLSFAKKVPSS